MGCTGWTAVILFTSVMVPLLGPFLSLLTPLPFLFYSTKLGLKEGAKTAVLSLVGIAAAAQAVGLPAIALIAVELGLLGLALSALFRIRMGIGQTIFFATALLFLLSLGYLFVLGLSKGIGPVEMVRGYLHGYLMATVEAYREMGIPPEKAADIERTGKAIIDMIFPSLAIVGMGFTVWLNLVTAKPLFRFGKLHYPGFGPMDQWHAPDAMIWGFICSGFICWGFAAFGLSGIIASLAANVLIVLIVIYLFHGLSILLFFLNKYRLPAWVRTSVFLLIFIQQFFWVLLALAGIFDQWIDFRKLRKEEPVS